MTHDPDPSMTPTGNVNLNWPHCDGCSWPRLSNRWGWAAGTVSPRRLRWGRGRARRGDPRFGVRDRVGRSGGIAGCGRASTEIQVLVVAV